MDTEIRILWFDPTCFLFFALLFGTTVAVPPEILTFVANLGDLGLANVLVLFGDYDVDPLVAVDFVATKGDFDFGRDI